jgi:hypothetical protein
MWLESGVSKLFFIILLPSEPQQNKRSSLKWDLVEQKMLYFAKYFNTHFGTFP